MVDRIKIGIVGIGQRGLQHLGTLLWIEHAEVVALCDPFPENLEEEKIRRYIPDFEVGSIKRYTVFDEMLRESHLDAVYFCVPPGLHDGELLRAAERGIHIFAEKPMSLFLDEALAMERAIREAGVIAAVGFQLRYDSRYTAIKEFLRDKRMVMITVIGNGALEGHSVKHTKTEILGGPPNRVWTANFAWSGSTVVEAGIHPLDLMRYWVGDVVWTQASYVHRDPQDIVDGGDNPYAYAVTFGFTCGMVGNLLTTKLRRTFYGDSYQHIVWDHGYLKVEADGPVAYYYTGPYPPPGPVDPASLRHPLTVPPPSDTTLAINEAFVNAVATQDEGLLRSRFSDGMNSLTAVLAANASDQLNGERISLREFLEGERYAAFRRKPSKR
ncbi:MAG: Gfo/Idh/MocA family oxidoreductase [Candidatus Latescibacteria bacterium]|nr:Gfo/Idh/MocA family oxidoreductase [Candidatus Latescibacterota bacterium]